MSVRVKNVQIVSIAVVAMVLAAVLLFLRHDGNLAASAQPGSSEHPFPKVPLEPTGFAATSAGDDRSESTGNAARVESHDGASPAALEEQLSQEFLETVQNLAGAIHNQGANLDSVLDLAIVVADAALKVEPVFDAREGGLVYTIPGPSDAVLVQLIALPQMAPMKDQFRMRVALPDAPGYMGPQGSVGGSDLNIHFNSDGSAVTTFSASARVKVHQTTELKGYVQTLGPVQVASHLSVTADGAKWTPMTLDFTTQDGQEGWLSAGGQQVPAVGNLDYPIFRDIHGLLDQLKPGRH